MSQQAATAEALTSGGSTSPWTEDWLAVAAGLVVFLLALALLFGGNRLGWATAPRTWLEIGKSVRPASPAYAQLEPGVLLLITYGFVLVLMTVGAALLRRNIVKFVVSFTVVFWLSYFCWVLGNYAYIAATTPDEMQRLGMAWSLRLTGEFGYVCALLAGLAIGNLPPALAKWLKEAARPELYIKTAIVIMGAVLGVKAAEQLGLATNDHVPRPLRHRRGLPDLLGGRLLRGPQVLQVQPGMGRAAGFGHLHLRRLGRHRHRRRHPGPADCADHGLLAGRDLRRGRDDDPALRWRRRSSGTSRWSPAPGWGWRSRPTAGPSPAARITDALIRAKAAAPRASSYRAGLDHHTTTTVKMFIDIFIGIWAFILAYIWSATSTRRRARRRSRRDLGALPKFVLGYVADLR